MASTMLDEGTSLHDNTDVVEEEPSDDDDHDGILVGSGEYQIVGIRYYPGVAHPGEYVTLVREPHNPYDRNAIRVDNLRGEKVGHVKATSARLLAAVMDSDRMQVRLDGTIPRGGNAYTLPLTIDFYSLAASVELTSEMVRMLERALKKDYQFRLARAFGGSYSHSSYGHHQQQPVPAVVRKKLDWGAQQKALDDMFDKQLENQYKDLPDLPVHECLEGITLFDYQLKGIRWLVQRETSPTRAPFYKPIREKGQDAWLCEITNSSQPNPPEDVRGSLLCDQMGLGKSIQTIGLILAAPPTGVTYTRKPANTAVPNAVPEKENLPIPSDYVIRAAKAPVLKTILKKANLKVSGKKQALVDRILEGASHGRITGHHFPASLRPVPTQRASSSSCRCTLIVCPVSVMSNWTHQFGTHVAPGVLKLELYHGPNRTDKLADVRAGTVDVLLVSYQTLAADYGHAFPSNDEGSPAKKTRRDSLFDIGFHRIVLDEAHTIRNSKTKFFKAVQKVKADRKLALTGTPFVNRSDDVHSLLAFLGVEPLADKSIFTRAVSTPIKNGDDLGLTRLRTCMGFVSLRRSKQNVNIQLVEKDVQLCSVEFASGDGHQRVYEALFGTLRVAMRAILSEGDGSQALKHYTTIFEKLLRLRQSCCSGTLVTKQRRDLALKLWNEVRGNPQTKPLTKDEGLALLEKLKGAFAKESDLPECGICLCEMELGDGTILKSCNHVFCKSCIRQVLNKCQGQCPYCRARFTESDVVDLNTAEHAAASAVCSEAKTDDSIAFSTPPKILALLDAIRGMKADEKGVIFSQFTSYLDLIGDALTEAGHSFVRIDGSVPAQKRIARIHRFNSDDRVDGQPPPRFILCSLLASGTGINLTRGNWAFMMDCWWNEAIESQAMDRIHRINQTRKVTILRFVMKDSIEERIVALQEAKSLQAKGVLQKLKGDEKRKALLGELRGLLQIEDGTQ